MAPDRSQLQVAVVHADESCLGNGEERPTPGGAGSLIEVRTARGVQRRDVYIASPETTNNRMALAGAIATLALLSQKGNRFRVVFVSDSQYLVKGMREWVADWRARGWRRKGGAVENLELWQKLVQTTEGHDISWRWVRGHAGHPKNEYANDLAVQAARQQEHSLGAAPSAFLDWLAARQARDQFRGYDPDAAYAALESDPDGES